MPSRVFMICNAYESGFGHGLADDGLDLSKTPHSDPELGEAYQIGYETGRRMANQDAPECLSPALIDLARYFKSGNRIPVERATIRTDDFWKIINQRHPSRTAQFSLIWMRYGWKRFFTRDWWTLFLRDGN